MEVVTFEDIPYYTIIDYISPHLGAKEFGALSMMSVYLRDIFMSNDIWKRLYVNSLRDKFKITDKSIHVGPSLENHKKRKSVIEVPYSMKWGGYRWSYYHTPWYNHSWIYNGVMSECGCVPNMLCRKVIANDTSQRTRADPVISTLSGADVFNSARQHLYTSIQEHNKRQGCTHSHMCTNIDHYLLDTLDAPSSVRNYKDFRKQYLSKYFTQTKNDPTVRKVSSSVKRKGKKVEQLQRYIKELEKEIQQESKLFEKNDKLKKSLALALNK